MVKNTPLTNLIQVVQQLGGAVKDVHEARAGLVKSVTALNGLDLEKVPGEGIALTDNEVANVAA